MDTDYTTVVPALRRLLEKENARHKLAVERLERAMELIELGLKDGFDAPAQEIEEQVDNPLAASNKQSKINPKHPPHRRYQSRSNNSHAARTKTPYTSVVESRKRRRTGLFAAVREAVKAQPGDFTIENIRRYLQRNHPALTLRGKVLPKTLWLLRSHGEIKLVAKGGTKNNELNIYRKVNT